MRQIHTTVKRGETGYQRATLGWRMPQASRVTILIEGLNGPL